ncbi:MAG: hypothetical protein ACPGO3_12490 [Magnetospiraceae bacterium]
MSHISKNVGITLASAAAALFLSTAAATVAPSPAHAADGVKCVGANACKGHGACKTASNDCKGMNACKGQGWISTESEAACTDQGGTVEKS